MLSRRYLRIKVMQTLYAYSLSKKANQFAALDLLTSHANSNGEPDLKVLKDAFNSSVEGKPLPGHIDFPDILNEALSVFRADNSKDSRVMKKRMVTDAERIYDQYLEVLSLIIELIRAEDAIYSMKEEKSRIGKNHKEWKRVLADNQVMKIFLDDQNLQQELERRKIVNAETAKIAISWFKDFVISDTEYNRHFDWEPNFEEDRALVRHLVKGILFKEEVIDKFFEEKLLHWTEDKAILKSMVDKTVKNLQVECTTVDLADFSYNWEEDRQFFEEIFDVTLEKENELDYWIELKSKNWEMERLALIDLIILRLALAEMLYFPSIPVKVTINEYIEISKKYSTPKSRQFVNGILDVLSKELKEKGLLKKSGRGLLDNK
jgi:N utilization substance protein B